ncbi:hypothetical protein [Bacillus benzoevorans]|uniref:Uncharacterized protein n=1 Tax=Bacillus benzoevorans TaxID=1456 RepID=A0A7X0LYK1_9BACI|nr:hypothetical protein [Bacillus benzoevorans]MBB6447597.1 hypothetical protein [Bacillus benzoevorans]
MNYLFWNTNEKPVNGILEQIILDKECDIISLAEYTDNITQLLSNLKKAGVILYEAPKVSSRINVLSKMKLGKRSLLTDSSYYTVLEIPHPSPNRFHIGL